MKGTIQILRLSLWVGVLCLPTVALAIQAQVVCTKAAERLGYSVNGRLHTEALAEKYGSKIYPDIVHHDNAERIVFLKDEATHTARTLAITKFEKLHDPDVLDAHHEIANGGAIGQTFAKHGFTIRKNVIGVFAVKLPKWLQNEFNDSQTTAQVRITEFYVKQSGKPPVLYGTISETYSPDFIVSTVTREDAAQVRPSTGRLQRMGYDSDAIWRMMEGTQQWPEEVPETVPAVVQQQIENRLLAVRPQTVSPAN